MVLTELLVVNPKKVKRRKTMARARRRIRRVSENQWRGQPRRHASAARKGWRRMSRRYEENPMFAYGKVSGFATDITHGVGVKELAAGAVGFYAAYQIPLMLKWTGLYNVIGNGLTAIVGGYIVGNYVDRSAGRAFFVGGALITIVSAARMAYNVVAPMVRLPTAGLLGQARPEELFGQARPEELFGQARPEELFGAQEEIFGISTGATEDTIRPTAGIDALNLY